ncbi:hypothetical protein C8R43DRAFT_254040 [Mycena crocata]|nr:hypothetical protein C8R43DRAFT_254040 [Mycena crocata]
MNTFSAFRFAARTLLRPQLAYFPCLNPIPLHPRIQLRFKSKHSKSKVRSRNHDIPYDEVFLVDDDNVLVKVPLKRLLSSIDHKLEWVELVGTDPHPVVKRISKKQVYIHEKNAKGKQREQVRKNIHKEVQLTWGSEKGDLEHKVARIRGYLEMGAKVDIVFSTKTKTAPPLAKVMQEKLRETLDLTSDISTEWRPIEWRRNMAIVYLRGTVAAEGKVLPQGAEGGERTVDGDKVAVADTDVELAQTKSALPPSLSLDDGPSKPKGFIDLSSYGYQPPSRRNPLSGKKQEKRYGERS